MRTVKTSVQKGLLSAVLLISGLVYCPQPILAEESAPLTSETQSNFETQLLRLEIDLSSRQLTLYQGDQRIKTYPVAVGREGWSTPTGSFQVMQMIQNPTWRNPFTGEVIGGGNDRNPLGHYWIGFWTDGSNWVGMHGTPNPESVGRAASHGCVRLYNGDIQELFSMVQVGTPVVVVP